MFHQSSGGKEIVQFLASVGDNVNFNTDGDSIDDCLVIGNLITSNNYQ